MERKARNYALKMPVSPSHGSFDSAKLKDNSGRLSSSLTGQPYTRAELHAVNQYNLPSAQVQGKRVGAL